MSLRDELLSPIAGENPGGVDMRYDAVFDKIKEARREDEDIPQGEWATARKVADWPTVIKLAKDVLANKSKDLQVAAWLTEALLRREGFAGLRDGLDLLGGLVEQHWDHLYPEIDDGDAEMRAAPIDWVSRKLDYPVRLVALDRSGHNLQQQKDSRLVPSEADALGNRDKAEERTAAVAEGKVTPEAVEAGFNATPKTWFRTLIADLEGSQSALKALDDVASDKFGDVSPNFAKLRDALEEVHRAVGQQLKRKLELDPDPVEVVATNDADLDSETGPAATAGGASGPLAAEPVSFDDAASRIVGAARYLRQTSPHSPAPYLMLRGFRWGELRANTVLDPRMLEAPPTSVRTKLKGLLLDAKWPELLETAETVLGAPYGRGWIDLQRYALTACESLGGDYDIAAAAMRGALRSLLADLPQLLEMTMMDDTSTANAETRAWLRTTIFVDQPAGDGGSESVPAPESFGEVASSRDPVALAYSELKAGRSERAIAILMRESSREKTRRGRFLLQSALARVMVDSGHEPVAMPILEELIADIEGYRLEEWESGQVVAAPMTLLFRCLDKTQADEGTKQSLYLRICRLDPIQAINFGPR